MLGLDKTLRTIKAQLGGLTVTAQLLIGALVVIMIMALVMVASFAGRADLVPLGVQGSLSAEARSRAISYLDVRNVAWRDEAGELLVPPDQRYAVLAELTEQELIRSDQIDFDVVFQDTSPFVSRDVRQRQYLVAKMKNVGRMISSLSGIEQATVVIDEHQGGYGLGAARIEPSASVTVLTSGEALSRTKADAIARIVADAHAPLKVEHVTVVDQRSGTRVRAATDDELMASQYYDRKVAAEKHARRTIEEALSLIPGVIVAVNAQVDATRVESQSTSYEDPKTGLLSESGREISSTTRSLSGEPGVRPNTGVSLADSGGAASQLTDTRTDVESLPFVGRKTDRTHDPKGYAIKINAAISVPRSYFVRLFQEQADDPQADPSDAELDDLVARETDRIRAVVEPLVDTGAVPGAVEGAVVVTAFPDFAAGPGGVMARAELASASGGEGFAGGLADGGMIRTISLATLALLSVGFMFFMVRKATRHEPLPTAEELVGIPPALTDAESDVVGEAAETEAAMEGLEIDESTMRRQQMVSQINDLAKGSPDEAANLLRRWMKSDE